MSTVVERYDAAARDYARYWAPVLEATARRLLERLERFVAAAGGRVRLIDIGTGTGTLALSAARRWPAAEVMATDAAAGMLDVARARATESGLADAERMRFVVGSADRLPLAAGSVDLVVSSFVLQLVPDRLAALREAHRLLRPGGRLAYVTWLDRDLREPFRPAEEFDEAVMELNVEEPEEADERVAGDVASPSAAANQLRRAGFRRVSAEADWLTYDWQPDAYVDYKLSYDERALVSRLDGEQLQRLEAGVRRRLAALTPADFRWQAPIVFADGERPR